MTNPDCVTCPSCCGLPTLLCHRTKGDDVTSKVYAGSFYGCECRALTVSLAGIRNLRGEVAETYGIKRKSSLILARPPLKRKSTVVVTHEVRG